MEDLAKVLEESFRLLKERPRIFLPKLISTFIGAVWFIGIFSNTGQLFFYAVTGPLVVLLGVFVSIMLASMVKNRDAEDILSKSFHDTLNRWKQLLGFSLIVFLAGILVYIPAVIGFALYWVYSSLLFLVAGALLSLLMVFGFGFLIYFFPISLLEKNSVLKGLKDSSVTSLHNSKEVTLLTVFSLLILAGTSTLTNQSLQIFGYAIFLGLRLLSGVITTYVFVVSPTYYLND